MGQTIRTNDVDPCNKQSDNTCKQELEKIRSMVANNIDPLDINESNELFYVKQNNVEFALNDNGSIIFADRHLQTKMEFTVDSGFKFSCQDATIKLRKGGEQDERIVEISNFPRNIKQKIYRDGVRMVSCADLYQTGSPELKQLLQKYCQD